MIQPQRNWKQSRGRSPTTVARANTDALAQEARSTAQRVGSGRDVTTEVLDTDLIVLWRSGAPLAITASDLRTYMQATPP